MDRVLHAFYTVSHHLHALSVCFSPASLSIINRHSVVKVRPVGLPWPQLTPVEVDVPLVLVFRGLEARPVRPHRLYGLCGGGEVGSTGSNVGEEVWAYWRDTRLKCTKIC